MILRNGNEYCLGIDIGAVSIKIALLAKNTERPFLETIFNNHSEAFSFFDEINTIQHKDYLLITSNYEQTKGEPFLVTLKLLQKFTKNLPSESNIKIAVTGSGGKTFAEFIQCGYLNEFQATAYGVAALHPDTRTILEIGGDSSKYIKLNIDPVTGFVGIADYEVNGDCAAGTGSFMDQQASRLLYDIEDVGDVVLQAQRSASIAGRCSVFAKSDMIHAQQKGYKPPEILKGLCEAVVRNFKGTITKSKEIVPSVAFIGGVAANKGVLQAVKEVFQLTDDYLFIPKYYQWMAAIGAALICSQREQFFHLNHVKELISEKIDIRKSFSTSKPISTEKIILLRDQVQSYEFPKDKVVTCYLGIDIGSVTTKLVLIDTNENIVHQIYTRTQARPIEVVKENLKNIANKFGKSVKIIGVGTTGSGRELIGELIGADVMKDEITAHKTGAMNVSARMTGKKVDTIFDIGGQDSKYISIENGVVVDFTMNEACAAGTGSFLEEQAERLGINIQNDFAKLALNSTQPVRLGERCTVFMEKDIIPFLQQGATKEDISAGLAFSIVFNYLNRVVRGRKIGDVIYFQGGTAYNDAVTAAFATVLDKQIIVPPYNGVIGAIGAALLAKQKIEESNQLTTFRGYDIDKIAYQIRNFTCKGCSNFCDVQEFTVEGERTYWGDKCSEKYRKSVKRDKQSTIPDLFEYRRKLFFSGYEEYVSRNLTIGVARSMYFYDRFPFWNTYFNELGVNLVLSDETNKHLIFDGVESQVAEPCFPVCVAHGHFKNLLDKNVDFIFQPNVVNSETNFPQTNSYLCPWGQTLCFVFKQTPAFQHANERILYPNIRFADGKSQVKQALRNVAKTLDFSAKESDRAVERGYLAQYEFNRALLEKGKAVLQQLIATKEQAIVLLGRPYNIYDSMINLNIPKKLRELYGINVIPIDFLAADDLDIGDITENMFWNYGRKILQVAKMTRDYPNLHLIYITNFKCGPDSYIKHYVRDACQKPYLTLQFDGHGNDAGIITRCEAYLDSKGFLR